MFPESFVQRNLAWSRPGELIFDPFAGRGTTILESLLNNRHAAGCDTNPVAYCVSKAKCSSPSFENALDRLEELRKSFAQTETSIPTSLMESPFFDLCFYPSTLQQILFLRERLQWREDDADCFLMALTLGCLHGESHRSMRYLSNRMPRTISTKPNYSVNWWRRHNCIPPKRDAFAILRGELDFRFATVPPQGRGTIVQGDARRASIMFPELVNSVALVITSPPYFDVTSFVEDQWLRIWLLGGPHHPMDSRGGDDRHASRHKYWEFLTEAWQGIGALLAEQARIVIRIGGSGLALEETSNKLAESLRVGLNRAVHLVEASASLLQRRQTQAFRPNSQGIKQEFDLHFVIAA
jgi:hypothetical protein